MIACVRLLVVGAERSLIRVATRGLGCREVSHALRELAYTFGNFTTEARTHLHRTAALAVPDWLGMLAARLGAALPTWVPGTGSLIRTGQPTALEVPGLGVTFISRDHLRAEVLAHEFTHHLFDEQMPRELQRRFLADFETLLRDDAAFAAWFTANAGMEQYGDPRAARELHQRVIEYFRYGAMPMPRRLRLYYERHFRLSATLHEEGTTRHAECIAVA